MAKTQGIGMYEDRQAAAAPSNTPPVDRARSRQAALRALGSVVLFLACGVGALVSLRFLPGALFFGALCLGSIALCVNAWTVAYGSPSVRITTGARVVLVLATVVLVLVVLAVPVAGGLLFALSGMH